jgi:nitroreductase / dihydropteridine reductase
MDIIKALNWRYAVKKFDTKKKLTTKQLSTIKEILRLTPTSHGIQWMKLHIIEDQKTKDKLFPYSNNQPQITSCSHLMVFTIPEAVTEKMVDDFVALMKSVRGGDKETLHIRKTRIENALMNYKQRGDIDCWLKQQVNIAL